MAKSSAVLVDSVLWTKNNFGVEGGPAWNVAKFIFEGGQVPHSNNLGGGGSKKTPNTSNIELRIKVSPFLKSLLKLLLENYIVLYFTCIGH